MLIKMLIICPLLFLAGVVDAIGGGGGLISLPAYLFAGFPVHSAIATNKLASSCGTAVATVKLLKNRKVNIKLAVLSVICAAAGSSVGSRLSLTVDDNIILYVMIAVLPICAFFVLNKKLFGNPEKTSGVIDGRVFIVACVSALIIGAYDGFYGPGTGTFLIIAFTVFARLEVNTANAYTKIINLTTGVTAFFVFAVNGQVDYLYGFIGAAFNMAGGYIGSGLALKKGVGIVRISILAVLTLLAVKILFFR